MEKNSILFAIKKMAEEDNQGLRMSTSVVDVYTEKRGSVVSFGTEKQCGDDARFLIQGLPNKFIICAFFIDKEELRKYEHAKVEEKKKDKTYEDGLSEMRSRALEAFINCEGYDDFDAALGGNYMK